MQKLTKWGLCVLALIAAFGLGRGERVYTETDLARAREDAYNNGYHAGYDMGLTAEQSSIYDEAFAAGHSEGYDLGFTAGLSEGTTQAEEMVQIPQHLASVTPLFPSQPSVTESTDIISSVTASETEQISEQITVYITNSGTKYHLDGCRHLKSKIEKTLEEAKALHLEPCKVCNPPK